MTTKHPQTPAPSKYRTPTYKAPIDAAHSGKVAVASAPCPPWCERRGETLCAGDHWASPGGASWPAIAATAFGPALTFAPAPAWVECDGEPPAVTLFISEQSDSDDRIETAADLTPSEALALAAQLVRAVEAVNGR